MASHKILENDELHKKYIVLEPYRLTGKDLQEKMQSLGVPQPVWKYGVDPNCSYFFGIVDEFAPYDYHVFIGNKYKEPDSGEKLSHCKSYIGHVGITPEGTMCPGGNLISSILKDGVDPESIETKVVTARFLWKALGTEILEKRVYPKFETAVTEKEKKSKEKAKSAQFTLIAEVITEPMTREQIAKKLSGMAAKKVFRALRKMSKSGELKKKRTEDGAVLFFTAGKDKTEEKNIEKGTVTAKFEEAKEETTVSS